MQDSATENRKPKLKDIADKLGVSIGTVSRVMNGKTTISADVSKKIKQLAREMGYKLPKSPAKDKQKKGGLGTIGYLFSANDAVSAHNDAFYQRFLNGVQQVAGLHGGHVIYAPCYEDIKENRLPSLVAENAVKGVVLFTKSDTPTDWIRKIAAQVPVVWLNGNPIEREVPSVTFDNPSAVYQSLRHLRELNHKRIGFLSIDDVGQWSLVADHQERLEAFLKYMPLLGGEMLPQMVQIPVRDHAKESCSDAILRALKNMLALGKKRPTAIVCATDVYAVELLRLAGSLGLSIPKDLSVISLRNTDICSYTTPSVTSISLQEFELGRRAAELLRQRIKNPGSSICHLTVAPQLIKRQSCALI